MKYSGIPWLNYVPNEWRIEKIRHLLSERNEKNEPIKTKEILSLTAKQGVIPIKDKECGGNKPKDDISAYKLAYPNDIVMNSMNILSGAVGLSSLFGCVSPVYYVLFPTSEEIYQPYYNLIFQTPHFQRSLRGLGNGILIKETDKGTLNTIRMRIPMDKLRNLEVPFPSYNEQVIIADFLDKKCAEIDEMIALQEKIIDELKAYKQSVITEAVTKGLIPDVPMKNSGIEWIGEMPEHWQIGRMKNVCCQNGESLSEKENEDFEFDYVDIGSVSFEKGIFHTEHYAFKDAPSRARRRAKYGDFIMSTVRTYLRAIDVIDSEEKASFIYSTGFAVLTPNTNISYRFLSYISKSQPFLEQVMLFSRGINYPSINSTDLMCIRITYPSIAEQTIIAEYLDRKCSEIDSLITIKLSKIDSLKEYKKSIIYEYVTGKKEVEA